ncbi:MAG: hypothetical protein CMJ85_01875 [Planctomycetes bacterium]|jgi:phytoene dehydrogenase-like protein|nr:hypothetical protein [Planctomycetota bacterium]MDP6424272.1 NAD(P)/FAD-dependent oxidoreductase [Planctomycetota bacterium]
MSFDALVIGGGHNGLVAALKLARAGRRIAVFEARGVAGGLCARREFHPGYRVPGLWHDTAGLRSKIVDELGLAAHGLTFRAAEPSVLAVTDAGPGALLSPDDVAGVSARDASAYAEWRAFIGRVRGFVRSVLDSPPPPMDVSSLSSLWQLARRGLALRRLGRDDMIELMRVAPMCVADWLNESFESQVLCGALALPGVQSTFMGPWSPGSAINLLFAECAADRSVTGGPAALIDALLAACEERGVVVRTGTPVTRIRTANGCIAGITTADGEDVDAPIVAASCDPKRTMLELLAPCQLPLEVEESLRVVRTRGTTAAIHLALDGPLEFRDREGVAIECARISGGSLDELERAFDAVKYRRFSERPALDVRVPTLEDPSLAPEGHQVVSILASFVPREVDGGWDDTQREALGAAVVERLAAAAPSVRDRIVARAVWTPEDLEADYGLTGGHLQHGEHALDQLLFMRPAPSCAHYRTPVKGLFLCGSGSHPGGGITGQPGALAAKEIVVGHGS